MTKKVRGVIVHGGVPKWYNGFKIIKYAPSFPRASGVPKCTIPVPVPKRLNATNLQLCRSVRMGRGTGVSLTLDVLLLPANEVGRK